MIKIIAFDFVGVLVNEKDIELTSTEEKLEKMFGPNITDSDYLSEANKLAGDDSDAVNMTKALISKIYNVRDKEIFKTIKERYSNLKIIIATNHLSFIRSFISDNFDVYYLDDLIISAEIKKIKPNADFYEYILNKYDILADELLFIDDNSDNIRVADELNINTIKVEKDMNLLTEIIKAIDNCLIK